MRREEIEDAAYALLDEQGYDGFSMLGVARRAGASNETLYRWYGDKPGLIAAMVERNVAEVRAALDDALAKGEGRFADLREIGRILLQLLVGSRATALNRAAAADPGGTLGKAISRGGRETVLPLIARLIEASGPFPAGALSNPQEAAEIYVRLLAGDLQIRRVIAVIEEPPPAFVRQRADRAYALLCKLLDLG